MSKERGLSMIELVLVTATVGFLVLLISNLPASFASITRSQHQSVANTIANKQLEIMRKQGVASLSNGTAPIIDSSLAKLPFASASYTISDCPVTICTNLEPMKYVQVSVLWKELKEQKKVVFSTLVTDKGVGQ